jgi:hypothetical protein
MNISQSRTTADAESANLVVSRLYSGCVKKKFFHKRSGKCIGQTTDDYCNWWKELANTSAQNMFKIEYLREKNANRGKCIDQEVVWRSRATNEVVTVQGKQ